MANLQRQLISDGSLATRLRGQRRVSGLGAARMEHKALHAQRPQASCCRICFRHMALCSGSAISADRCACSRSSLLGVIHACRKLFTIYSCENITLESYTCENCIWQREETLYHLFLRCNFAKAC
jgi:hypothetical protein